MKKRAVKILTGVAIVLVAWGVVYAIWMGVSAAKLRRAYAALREDGRPMEAAEVIPPQVEDTENAALLYESAGLLLKAIPAPWPDAPDPTAISVEESINRDKHKDLLGYLSHLSDTFLKVSLEEDKRTELERLLADEVVLQAISTVRLGTERPACRFDIDHEAGLSATLDHLLTMKGLLRILRAKTRMEAEAGQPVIAWDLGLTQLRFADAMRTEPVIISQVVRISNIAITCRTLQHLCAVAPPSQQQLAEIDRLLEGLDDIAPLAAAVDAERVMIGEFVFRQPRHELKQTIREYVHEDHVPDLFNWFRTQRILYKPAFLADHAAYLRCMHEYARLFEGLSPPGGFRRLEDAVEGGPHRLSGRLVPAMRRVNHLHARMTAEIHITRAGMTLLRQKGERGSWPENLDVLGIDNIDDPFARAPLRYRPEGDGFVLYSVGEDREDNGGVAKEGKQERDFDIVWRFPEQPTR